MPHITIPSGIYAVREAENTVSIQLTSVILATIPFLKRKSSHDYFKSLIISWIVGCSVAN